MSKAKELLRGTSRIRIWKSRPDSLLHVILSPVLVKWPLIMSLNPSGLIIPSTNRNHILITECFYQLVWTLLVNVQVSVSESDCRRVT